MRALVLYRHLRVKYENHGSDVFTSERSSDVHFVQVSNAALTITRILAKIKKSGAADGNQARQ